jgi:predicted O-methyltransferase YrrM
MNLSPEELRNFSDVLVSLPDDRPQWLKDMPYARESPEHYYVLLWQIVKRYKPEFIVEIGIDKGGSTLTLAAANPAGRVMSVDIDKAACVNAYNIAVAHRLTNLEVVHDDSLNNIKAVRQSGKQIDLLFVDGAHDFLHCRAEYEGYRPLMKQGGIILFDDIHESREMEQAWESVVDPKCELPKAHWTGFGACKVEHSIPCPSLTSIPK